MVLAISDTLNLKAEDFLKFIDLYVEQDTELSRLLLPVEENDLAMNKCAKEVNQTIKSAFALKLLSSVLFQVTLSLQFQIFLLELQIIQLRLLKNSLNNGMR